MNQKNSRKHIYTIEEIQRIIRRFENNKTFICAFLTACYTGMRTGEVFALTWDDIDLEKRIIKITKTVYAKDRSKIARWYIGSVKTECSYREVYICDTLYSILLNYKDEQDNNKKEYGIFKFIYMVEPKIAKCKNGQKVYIFQTGIQGFIEIMNP